MSVAAISSCNKKNIYLFFPIIFFFTCFFLSVIIPPFQSPDEIDHIKRAYLLSHGKIILETPPNQSSGGMINTGLMNYQNGFANLYYKIRFKLDGKLSAQEINLFKTYQWSNNTEFQQAPGTSYYFPLIYLPQAIGLSIGEKLSLSIDTSYQLARWITLFTTCFLLFYAFLIYRTSTLVIALLVIPMSLFQFSSASLDGISTAVAILSLSIFMRITTDKECSKPWYIYLLTLCVLIVVSCRMHLLPLLLLIPASFFYTKNKASLYLSCAASLLILLWIYIAMHYAIDNRIPKSLPLSAIFYNYIRHPMLFIGAMTTTLSNTNTLNFYAQSFIGILGWLDINFLDQKIYSISYRLIVLISLFSISLNLIKNNWRASLLLITCAISSIILIFFLLLITWNIQPVTTITGIQGRYFLIPMLMIAYAFQYQPQTSRQYKLQSIGLLLVLSLYLFSVFNTTQLLIHRYYLTNKPIQIQE